jgi:hypothetical protein
MSSESDRLATIQDNYTSALDNEPHDLAAAQTPADVTAVVANVATARSVYFAAVAAQLSNASAAVEAAFETAKRAVKSVEDAREASAAFPNLLNQLSAATSAASDLLKLAKT